MGSLDVSSFTPTSSPGDPKARPFRVIIVGSGVAGLAFSHVFQKVGIDHVVLEKGVVAPPWGASISMWAHGSRILQQLGCLEALEAACLPLKDIVVRAKNGKTLLRENFFDMMVERNGYLCTTFERRKFLQIIYDEIPDKSFIREGKRVHNVVENDHGVRVEMTDGTFEEGDILLGCDGVHSTIREIMWRHANLSVPDHIEAQEKTSLVTTYTGLVGVCKPIPGLGIQDMTWVHNDELSFLFNSQPDGIYFFCHFKLPQQRTWPHTPRFTEADAERAAASVADHPIADSLVFGEIWKNRTRGVLISLEEGVFDHWSFGRTALVGDAVHKVTPNYALGANCALEGVAVMSNLLVKLYKTLAPGQHPSKATISELFHTYQETRQPRMKTAFKMSYDLTRLQTCDGWLNKITMLYLMPMLGFGFVADQLAEFCSGAPKLNFLPLEYRKSASVPWKDEIVAVSETRKLPGKLKQHDLRQVFVEIRDKIQEVQMGEVVEMAFGGVFVALLSFLLMLCF